MKKITLFILITGCLHAYGADTLNVRKRVFTLETNTALFVVHGPNILVEIPIQKRSSIWFEVNKYARDYVSDGFLFFGRSTTFHVQTSNFIFGYNYYFQSRKRTPDGFYVGFLAKFNFSDIQVESPDYNSYGSTRSYGIRKTMLACYPQIGWQYCGKRGLVLDFGIGAGANRLLKETHDEGTSKDMYADWLFDFRVNMGIGIVFMQ